MTTSGSASEPAPSRCTGGAICSRSPPRRFIGFTGFTLVMPFLPLYFQQLGVTDVGAIALWTGLSLGVTPALTALLAPLWGRARRSLRPQDHGRALARQLRRRHGGDGVRHARRGRCSRCARSRASSPATARYADDGGRVGAARADGAGDRLRCRRRSGSGRRSGPVIGGCSPQRRPAPRVPRRPRRSTSSRSCWCSSAIARTARARPASRHAAAQPRHVPRRAARSRTSCC